MNNNDQVGGWVGRYTDPIPIPIPTSPIACFIQHVHLIERSLVEGGGGARDRGCMKTRGGGGGGVRRPTLHTFHKDELEAGHHPCACSANPEGGRGQPGRAGIGWGFRLGV